MTTAESRWFVFTEYADFAMTSVNERAWTPKGVFGGERGILYRPTESDERYEAIAERTQPIADDVATALIRGVVLGKFVYVFRRKESQPANVRELLGVVNVDDKANYGFTFGGEARVLAEPFHGPPKASLPGMRLVHTENGERVFHSFIVSREGLGKKAIKALEDAFPESIPEVDLASDRTFEINKQSGVAIFLLPVVDPITIANNFHATYREACDDYTLDTVVSKDTSDAQRLFLENRQLKVMIAEALSGALDNDAAGKLADDFSDGSGQVVKTFLRNRKNAVEQKILAKDRAAKDLYKFIQSSLMKKHVEEWYADFASHGLRDELHVRWVRLNGDWLRRAGETKVGQAYLAKIIDEKPPVVRDYFLRDSPPGPDQFAIGRKSAAAIITAWRELVPAFVAKHEKEIHKLLESLNLIAAVKLVHAETDFRRYVVRGKVHFVAKKTTFKVITVSSLDGLKSWVDKDHGAPVVAANRLMVAVELVNLVISARDLSSLIFDKGFKEAINDPRKMLGTIGSALDAGVAIGAIRRVAEKTLTKIGLVSAAIDAGLAAYDTYDAYRRTDFDACVGFALVAAGSVSIMLGSIATLVEAGSIAGPLGLVGASAVALGIIITSYAVDSDVETFVGASAFGSRQKQGSKIPDWADSSLESFADPQQGLHRQVRALVGLIGAFSVKGAGKAAILVIPGNFQAGSELIVDMEVTYDTDMGPGVANKNFFTEKAKAKIDLTEKKIEGIEGDKVSWILEDTTTNDGRKALRILPRPASKVAGNTISAKSALLLKFDPEASYTVPVKGGPLRYEQYNVKNLLSPDNLSEAKSY